ncbi:MAG TPA: TIGR01777 family oxidoreductase, partial [Candidatus Binataceae bacterium]|nr:TIGR01777 family oxidoreductase [Candidatus Binataceae bacterium]
MRIFITGATGFIGRALTLRLLGGGHEVVAWVRSAARAASLLGSDVELVAASGGDQALSGEVARADAVINLAGEPVLGGRWSASRREALSRSRIGLTTSIADAIGRAGKRPAVLVSASAVGYYGDRGAEVVDENSPGGSDFLAGLCRDWEQAAQRAAQAGVRVFIPRIGVVLGLDGGALAQMLPPFQFGAGGPIGNGRQYMPWIHLFDLVELIATALEDPRYAGPAIAAAPYPVTSREFAHTLGRVAHRPSFLPVPAVALRVIFGDGASVLTSGQRVNPARLKELGFRWRFETLEAALGNIL